MIASIVISIAGLLLLGGLITLIYRTSRTFDANPNQTYIVQHKGDIAGALREPATLWSPSMTVLRDKKAPHITFPAMREKTGEVYTRSLVDKNSGRISLMVNTCTPKPFNALTIDGHTLEITAHVVFRLDIERIHIPAQLDNFGATLSNRIVNLFDNEISRMRDEEVRGRQGEIEASVTKTLREIELNPDDQLMAGMPLGIKIYEANFSFKDASAQMELDAAHAQAKGEGPTGPVWLDVTRIDRLADALDHRPPEVRDALMRLVELQTRQNIVETLCKSGGLVAFTAKELGLNDLQQDPDGAVQSNPMKAAQELLSSGQPNAQIEAVETAEPAPQKPELDYYGRPIRPASSS